MRWLTLVLCALAVVFSNSAFAQDTQSVNAMVNALVAEGSSEKSADSSSAASAASTTSTSTNTITNGDQEGLVSLDFQDADIKNVLKVLSYKSGVNIVAGPEVNGIVTIQLTNVPWQKALEVILSTYGYGYERKANIITVTTIENLKKRREDSQVLQEQEPLVTRTFPLSFSKASEIIDSINKMKTNRGTINYDPRTNTLIVRDVESNLELISAVIKKLDTVTPQVLIETKVVETNLNNDEKLGIDWAVRASASGAARPTTFPFKPTPNNKFLNANFPSPEDTAFTYGTLSATGFQAVLDFLSSRSDTHILSNPKIVTLDNQAAKITVGTQYPIPQYTYNTEQAKLQVSGWDYKDIGIVFEVTPHVNNPNLVTLDLHPKITDSNQTVTFESTQLPILSVEEATTKVMVENGQTLVMAGLIKDKTIVNKSQVPFLGNIPLIGGAFRHQENKKDKTELLIFLTPHIVTAQQPSPDPGHTASTSSAPATPASVTANPTPAPAVAAPSGQ